MQFLLVVEENADRFTVVDAADRLGENGGDVQDVELGSKLLLVLVLGYRVGNDQLVNRRSLDAVDSVTAEDTVSQQRVDGGGTLLLKELGGSGDGVAGIGNVVEKNADAIGNVTDEHHASVLAIGDLGRATLL